VGIAAVSFVVLVACSRDQPATVTLPAVAAASASASSAPVPVKRCLPIVAASCGCVYSCGVGTEVTPGAWSVTHATWGITPIVAKVAPWCVGGVCTDAFHGEIVCSVICTPKPADPTCHFQGDACVSGRDATP
jgi:hypothetical protein